MFAIDETRSASQQSAEITAGANASTHADVTPEQEKAREEAHSTPRELVDDANDILLSPFSSLSSESENKWLRKTVPALLGLLIFGFGLGYLARFASGRSS